jgi:hypothetical protein
VRIQQPLSGLIAWIQLPNASPDVSYDQETNFVELPDAQARIRVIMCESRSSQAWNGGLQDY